MKHQYKHINVTFMAILSLCLSGIVFSSISQLDAEWKREFEREYPIVEDITVETATVYIGGGLFCDDTLIIEGINLRVKRRAYAIKGYISGFGDGKRPGWLLLTDTDTLIFFTRNQMAFWWKRGRDTISGRDTIYTPIIDEASRRRFNDIVVAFEKSNSSCLYKEWEEMWIKPASFWEKK